MSSTDKYILSGWYYPSAPCWPRLDLLSEKHPALNQVCGEFMRFTNTTQPNGSCVKVMTEQEFGLGGYSKANVNSLKAQCEEVYCTISGRSESGVGRMLHSQALINATIVTIVDFCKAHGMHCDLNIEGLAAFSASECLAHAKFMDQLGKALKAEGIKFRLVTVAENGILYHGNWRNDLLENVTCDYVVFMNYDYMYDYGGSVVPLDWFKKTIERGKQSLGTQWKDKMVVGLCSYGYKYPRDDQWTIELVTRGQLAKKGYITLPSNRAAESQEIKFSDIDTVRNSEEQPVHYYFSDQVAIDAHIQVALDMGVNNFSMWHLFGGIDSRDDTYLNHWPSQAMLDKIIKGAVSTPDVPSHSAPEPTVPTTEPAPTPTPPTSSDPNLSVILFTGINMRGNSKSYGVGMHDLTSDSLIRVNQAQELIIKGKGSVTLYDDVFENKLATYTSEGRLYVKLGEHAKKADSLIVGTVQEQPVEDVVIAPTPVEPTPQPTPVEPTPQPTPVEPTPVEPTPVEPDTEILGNLVVKGDIIVYGKVIEK